MIKMMNWRIWTAVLAGLFIIGQIPVCFAQDPGKSDTEAIALAGSMLALGQEAHERGLYEKAGYYFLQAVKISPAEMAFQWYQLAGGSDGKKTYAPPPAKRLTPSPPSVTTPGNTVDPAPGIIIVDDEGC